jgi:tight adherence protein B
MVLLIVPMVFLCVALFVYALVNRGTGARNTLERRLQLSSGMQTAVDVADSTAGGEGALRASRIGKSGALTRTLSGIHAMQKLGDRLERAGWRMSVTEFLVVSLVTGVVAGLLVSLRVPALMLPGGAAGMLLPLLFMLRSISRRRTKFVKQLVETLPLIANGLKAGISLLQAMDQVAGQLKPPISVELRRVLRDIRMGASPDDAYLALNERIKSSDLDLVVNAIIVQRSTGGNLAEILDKVAYIMRERLRIRGEIKTLTAQQQFSGYMLAGVPMFLLVVFRLLNPVYMAPMFDTTAGHVLLGIGGAGQLLALFFVRKIVNIEV